MNSIMKQILKFTKYLKGTKLVALIGSSTGAGVTAVTVTACLAAAVVVGVSSVGNGSSSDYPRIAETIDSGKLVSGG